MFHEQFPEYGSKCVHSGNVVGENTKIKDVKATSFRLPPKEEAIKAQPRLF
jgi:hypothetical protein